MTDPTFGLSITTPNDEPLPALTANMSVIGIVDVAEGANALLFPLDTPVSMFSTDSAMLTALGANTPIYKHIAAINSQLGERQVSAQLIVVRVAQGVSDSATIANIRGDINARTGMFALLDSAAEHGITPRIILAGPGFTGKAIGQIGDTIAVTTPGTGYTAAPTVAFAGGGSDPGKVLPTATAVLTNGVALAIGAGGTGYTAAPTLTIAPPPTGGVQATATCTVSGGIINAVTVTNPGSGYLTPPAVTVTPTSGGSGGTINATLTGRVGSVAITNRGSNLTAAPTISFTGGSGSGAAATATFDSATNAICASLPTLLDRLYAVAVVDGPNSTKSAANNWRESLASKRIIPVDPAYKVLDSGGNIVVVPASPYVAGIGVRVDHEHAGVPSHSWANQPVRGIVGTARPIDFSIVDGATEGQELLAANIGTTVRGERTDDSIADGGYVFIGTDSAYASGESLWQFYHQVRMRDYMHLAAIRTLRNFLGKNNLTGHTIQAVLNTLNYFIRDLQAQAHILGGKADFSPDTNSPEQLRLGKLRVRFYAEEPPVLRYIGIESRRYRPALDILLTDLVAQLDLAA